MNINRTESKSFRLLRAFFAIILTIMMCFASIAPAVNVFAEDGSHNEITAEVKDGDGDAQTGQTQGEDSPASFSAQDNESTDEDKAESNEAQGKDAGDNDAKSDEIGQGAGNGAAADDNGANDAQPQGSGEDQNVKKEVALIGDEAYESLQAAVDAAKNGDVIKVSSDLQEVVTVSGKSITIDLDGHKLSAAANGEGKYGEVFTALINSDKADLIIKNGTISGGKSSYYDPGAINNTANLTFENITLSDSEGILIENNGKIIAKDCVIKDNYDSSERTASMIRMNANGASFEAVNTIFKDNKLGWGSLINSSYNVTVRLTSCDIKDNNVGSASISLGSSTTLYLSDTTITANTYKHASYNYSDATGGLKTTGKVYFDKSAVYGNFSTNTAKGKDFYINSLAGGEIPLPKDMYDHGRQLTEYVLMSSYDGVERKTPLKAGEKWTYSSFTVILGDGDEAVCEYGGNTYTSLAAAVEAMEGKPGTVKFIKDAAIGGKFAGHEGLVIDLDGHKITTKSDGISAISIDGGDITIKNGSFEGCEGDNGTAIYVNNANLKVSNVDFTGNDGRAIYSYHFTSTSGSDKDHYKLIVENCTFKNNGLDEDAYRPYSVFAIGVSAEIKGCTFDGNFSAIRMANSLLTDDEDSHRYLSVENCTFTGHKGNVVELYNAVGNDSTFTNCAFTDNHIEKRDSDNKSIVYIEEVRHYVQDAYSGGNVLMENCIFTGNSGGDATIDTSTGNNTFRNCLIEGNEGNIAGGIHVDPRSRLVLEDTVLKGNHSLGTNRASAGGVVLRAATYYNITPIVNGYVPPGGTTQNKGYFYSRIQMEGGAIYGNTNDNKDAAKDVYVVDGNGIENLLSYREMEDGDFDFIHYEAPENGVIINKRVAISQVFVDPVNGDDSNMGDRNYPVKTWVKAARLVDEYAATSIHVMNPIILDNESKPEETSSTEGDGEAGASRLKMVRLLALAGELATVTSAETTAEPEYAPVIDLGGKRVVRDYGHDGYLFEVKSGGLSITNTVIDGYERVAKNALIYVDEGASLTLGDGAQLVNNGQYPDSFSKDGGAVYSLGNVTVNDGALIKNNTATSGGGIMISGGTLTMSGGKFEGNRTYYKRTDKAVKSQDDGTFTIEGGEYYGGAVLLIRGAEMNMTGGEIISNRSIGDGGGIAVGSDKSGVSEWTTTLNMSGGTIDGNNAFGTGGGIFIQCNCVANVTGGYITNNTAQSNKAAFAGGGIYVNGYHVEDAAKLGIKNGRLYIDNLELGNNTAGVEGGAIAWCGAGSGSIYESEGMVIYDNKSLDADLDIKNYENLVSMLGSVEYDAKKSDILFSDVYYKLLYIDSEGHTEWEVSRLQELRQPTALSETMMNGASFNWKDEDGNLVPSEVLKNNLTVFRFNTDATASDPDVQESIAMAKVHVNGNYSGTNGGGIGCNGDIFIGFKPPEDEPPTEVEGEYEPPAEDITTEVRGEYKDEVQVKGEVKTGSVATGDASDIGFIIAFAAISAAAFAGAVLMRKRQEHQ